MTLAAGTRLGPYEVLSPIGAGGMGEVWKARDTRLQRDVAVKVLPPALADDADALARFEREARAVAALSHPGILAIHDVGNEAGTAYAVMELLEGETLRRRVAAGPIPERKALEYGRQIAAGLAAAHERGIVHRDLKPDNLFVTSEGRIKILDFGLAKENLALTRAPDSALATVPRDTDPGTVLGTVGYMAPEQVRGLAMDHRADLFSFGAVLYEMLSGQRAFRGDTAADTITQILTGEPPDLSGPGRPVSPALDRIVRHCLEKNPAERFQSARDIAFDLEALSTASSGPTRGAASARRARPWLRRAALLAVGLALAAAGVALLNRRAAPVPGFRRLTFKRGTVTHARFSPDAQTVVYSAAWEGRPPELFATRFDGPQSRPLGIADAHLLSISTTAQMALLLSPRTPPGFAFEGTLAEAPLSGGAPRRLRERVSYADLAPDGRSLAVVTEARGAWNLEYPAGRPLYSTAGWISHPRVAPDGKSVAFCDHPIGMDDSGRVLLVAPGGPPKVLAQGFASLQGLAFAPGGREVWFTAAEAGSARLLWAVTLSGKRRLLASGPGMLTLHDVDRAGRALVSRDDDRLVSMVLAPGESREQDVSELDYTRAIALSADGRSVLLDESGEGGGRGYSTYVRRLDGTPAVRISDGAADDLSPDGAWALVGTAQSPRQLFAVPTGAGERRALTRDGLTHSDAHWVSGSKRILFVGNEPGRAERVWVQDPGGAPRPITPEGSGGFVHSVSADGTRALSYQPGVGLFVIPLSGEPPRAVPGTEPLDRPGGWSTDGRAVFVVRPGTTARLLRVDLATGRHEPVRDLATPDPAGLRGGIGRLVVAADGAAYTYYVERILSDLYLVDGLR